MGSLPKEFLRDSLRSVRRANFKQQGRGADREAATSQDTGKELTGEKPLLVTEISGGASPSQIAKFCSLYSKFFLDKAR
jgi:hypothetical protein